MVRLATKTRQYLRRVTLTAGPFVGCRDATDPTTADTAYARLLRNVVRGHGPNGMAQVGRAGSTLMASSFGTNIQAVLTWTNASGVRITTVVADGEIYSYDFATDTKTKVVTTANLTTAGAALSSSARVSLVPFASELIISDGTNFALAWTGASGAGGITELPVKFYGPPTVHASKLVGIDATRRYVLFWSEEGDPTIGYDITVGPLTYTNAWDNPGGYNDPLTAVCGTNDGLYVFRERISLAILGAMGADYQTSHTRANLAADIGTISPWGVIELTQGVFIVDADAQPWLMKIGAPEPLPLWKDCQQILRDVPRLSLVNATTIYSEADGIVLLGLSASGYLVPTKWLTFHAADLQYNGPHTGYAPASCAGAVVDQFGIKRWAHGESTGGRVVAHDNPQLSTKNDVVLGVTQAIAHEIIGPYLGFDTQQELYVSQGEFGFTIGTNVTLGYETSRGLGSFASLTIGSTTTTGFILGLTLLGTGRLGRPATSRQATIGWQGLGRWVSAVIRHQTLSESFGHDVHRIRVSAGPGNPLQP